MDRRIRDVRANRIEDSEFAPPQVDPILCIVVLHCSDDFELKG